MTDSTVLSVSGMSCAGCVSSVERALREAAGVTDVAVNFADASAVVTGSAEPQQLIEAVEGVGYHASVLEDGQAPDDAAAIKTQTRQSLLKAGAALAFGVALMADMLFGYLPPPEQANFWLPVCLLAIAVMWFSGGHFYSAAVKAALRGRTTMDTLIALGTGAAIVYSLIVAIAPTLLPPAARHIYLEAAAFIVGFVGLGRAMEMNVRARTSLALRKLLDLAPQTATRVSDGTRDEVIPLAQVQVGDLLRVAPGEAVPVDGVVESGASSIDESLLTGESMPIEKAAGDKLVAGSINQSGALLMRAEQVGGDTQLANMMRMVQRAQNSKPAIGRLADRIASVFVPAVLVMAAATALVWWLVGPEPKATYMLQTTIAVLIIACPCALGLAVPISIMIGVGRAASGGILIRDGDALQAAGALTDLVLDKTGTLTQGAPQVARIEAGDEGELLRIAASLERLSEHPLARAVTRYAAEHNIASLPVQEFTNNPGNGLCGKIDGTPVAAGTTTFLRELGMSSERTAAETGTAIYVGKGSAVLGRIELLDPPRDSAANAIAKLKTLGIRPIMLSGDNEAAAQQVANACGLDYQANMKPEDKLAFVRALQAEGKRVGMVGDGINDAPALSAANVSLAMAGGSDIAIESADLTVLGGDLGNIPRAVEQSRQVMRNIKQNLAGAFAYNVLLIPVAAGALYPFAGLLLDPMFAGFAMAASSLTVVLNATRLRLAA